MEGQTKPTNKLKFIESKKKIKVENKILQPHLKLITTANKHNLTLIGCEDNTIKYIETNQLLDFTTSQSQIINQQATPLITLTFRPTLVSISRYGFSSILLIAGNSSFPRCPVVEVYDLDSRSTIDRVNLSDLGDSEIIDYAWHPNYYESIVALCTSKGQLLVLAINKQDKGIGIVYKNEQYGALTCCWSIKGKNLAVGTQRGHILRLEPVVGDNSFSFKEVSGSHITFVNPKITADHQIVKLRWLNPKYLIATHAKPNNPAGPETVYSILTVKPGKPYLYWTNVNFESQTGSNYVMHIANLSNSVVCMSSATGEAATIGVLGSNEATTNELNDWSALSIDEEGARIELPLDSNNGETHPCGLTMATWPQDGRPILIFYTNDGMICSYAVMHSDNILKFPEHINQPEQKFSYNVVKSAAPQSVFSTSSSFGGAPSFNMSGPAFGKSPTFNLFAPSLAAPQVPATTSDVTKSTAPQGVFSTSSSFGGAPAFSMSGPAFGKSPTFNLFAPSFAAPPAPTTTQPNDAKSSAPQSIFGLAPSLAPPPAPTMTQQNDTKSAAPQSLFGLASGLTASPVLATAQPNDANSAAPQSLFGLSSSLAAPSFSTTTQSNDTKSAAPQSIFGLTSSFATPPAPTTTQPSDTKLAAPQSIFGLAPSLAAPPNPTTTKPPDTKPAAPQSIFSLTPSLAAPRALTTSQPNEVAKLPTLHGLSVAPSVPTPTVSKKVHEPNVNAASLATISDSIRKVREKLDFNSAYITLFEELNHLRDRFDETLDLHRAHHEALEAVKDDIDRLDLEVLETFYLIEYVKSRISCDIKKRSIDPITTKKVNNIKMKLKHIGAKLEELSDHVDVAWEDFVRRRSTKERRVISLDAIYKALATNQKVINVLKKKVEIEPEKPTSDSACNVKRLPAVKRVEEDLSKFEEFLASRSVVPVRKPIHLTQ